MGCVEPTACANPTEAFNGVLASVVRVDEVLAMEPEGTLTG
jgi:hypothetical protein